jgi:NADPH-dependent curcumin reductase CurA
MTDNNQWLIAERPIGRPVVMADFKHVLGKTVKPKSGQVLVKILYLGFDPAQKGWMENLGGYVAPTQIGDVMRATAIGQVIESQVSEFEPGDTVLGPLGWQEYATLSAKDIKKIPNDPILSANLSVLGTTGMTAYFGLFDVGKPRAGDTVVVSGAAGATGSIVGQLAKLSGCHTIGIAGGEKKCKWLTDDVGYDQSIDYKNQDVKARLKEKCPGLINVFYDNVGGDILNYALANIDMNARVVICGGISRYEQGQMPKGPENYFNLIFKRATMQGFIVIDYISQFPEAQKRMRNWIKSGDVVYKEDIQTGFENIPTTFQRLFSGKNFGKQLLKLADPE